MKVAQPSMVQVAQAAKLAARRLSHASTAQKDEALTVLAKLLKSNQRAILAANRKDVGQAKKANLAEPLVDRLTLTAARVDAARNAVMDVVKLNDPVGEETDSWRQPNGLLVRKVRLPLGVILMIYESRPNVTIEATALALKSGNALILRGGKEAYSSNLLLVALIQKALRAVSLPIDAAQLVPPAERQSIAELVKLTGLIDLCIPRGGKALIDFVSEHARVPVVRHAEGVCHVYVHAQADPAMATRIVVNAKTSRPGVCNSAECLLIDALVARQLLPDIASALIKKGVELRLCPRSLALLQKHRLPGVQATDEDYGREFLSLIMAVKIVDGLDQALEHIARFGSEHSEAIVTNDRNAARQFVAQVSASAVLVNASTRLNDGTALGLGAEIGISTSRLHAFGPMGLKELTAQKYVIEGDGHIR
jgi:glutamate-5-semialdehyde dehydrogenase